MKRASAALAGAVAVALSLAIAAAEEPEVVSQFPLDGAILEEAPLAIQLCFRDPIDIRDLRDGGYFEFVVIDPGGTQLGTRAIFQPDAHGVVVQPGLSSSPEGGWRFEWRLRDSATEDPAEGTIRYTVKEGGGAIIPAEPPSCGASVSPSPSSPGTNGNTEPDEGDGPDVLLLALLTTGAAAGAAVIAGIGYLVRRRMGFSMHKPPRDGGGAPRH